MRGADTGGVGHEVFIVEAVHFEVGDVFRAFAYQTHPLLDGEIVFLVGVGADGGDKSVENRGALAQNVHVAVGYRIERTGIDCDAALRHGMSSGA
jgi:hypothetical protein